MPDRVSQASLISGIILSMRTDSGGAYEEIAEVTDCPSIGGSSPNVDATTIADRQKKYIAGLPDPGELTLKVNFVTKSKQHQKLYEAQYEIPKSTYEFKIAFPDGTAFEWSAEVGGMKLETGQAGNLLAATISLSIKSEFTPAWVTP